MVNGEMEKIIPLSRKKIIILALLSIGFLALGGFSLSVLDQVPRFNITPVRILLIVSTIFFVLAFLYLLKKLIDNSPGLILNAQGIHDNSSAVAAGEIPWSEITDISVTEVSGQRFITVRVRYPQRFMNKGHYLKKLLMKANLKLYGSPIQISANSLQIEFDHLLSSVEEYYERYAVH